jgi:hypothetical protein
MYRIKNNKERRPPPAAIPEPAPIIVLFDIMPPIIRRAIPIGRQTEKIRQIVNIHLLF